MDASFYTYKVLVFLFVALNHYAPTQSASCSNYWQSNNDGASSTLRPFDICYRSYRNSVLGDYSYRYTCDTNVVNQNMSVNGYTVYKQLFNGVGCKGEPNATLRETTEPYNILCGGTNCDVVRYRVYDIYPNSTSGDTAQCTDTDYPSGIKERNNYTEYIHVIERCDDDGFVSDSYFCSSDYYYKNSYNNDQCKSDGIYEAEYYFEGCNDNDEFIQMIDCGQDSGFTANDEGLKTWGIIFIVLALIAVICAISFVVYHSVRTKVAYGVDY